MGSTEKPYDITETVERSFKPRYQEQFDLAHNMGMHVYFHSCGYIYDIISDLIDIGVDILNLNQPDFGFVKIYFSGDTCYNKIALKRVVDLKPEVALLPINGTFGNLDACTASFLAEDLGSEVCIPCHFLDFSHASWQSSRSY